jgi:exodeoxyribonuclease VII small subunit
MTKNKHSFEEDLERLQKIVDELASGRLTLAESIKKYEEGVKLTKECSSRLNEAQRKVQLLTKKNGKFSLENFDEEGSEGQEK